MARLGNCCYCGSIWRFGPSLKVPITEDNGAPPIGEYGIAKAIIARMLQEETRSGGLVTTSLHPGHIVGPGWHPIGPLGNLDASVWQKLSAGEPIDVPGIGAELMHHVHADDVAQAFEGAVAHRDAAAGEAFNVVAPSALNVRGYAEIAASWFGQTAVLRSVTWDEFRRSTEAEDAQSSWEHLVREPLLQHRQGAHADRVHAAVRAGRCGAGVGPLADRPWTTRRRQSLDGVTLQFGRWGRDSAG